MPSSSRTRWKKWQKKLKTHGVEKLDKQQKILISFWTRLGVQFHDPPWFFSLFILFYIFFVYLTFMPFIYMQVRTGARVSNEEILGFAKLFNDELTLDNISRLLSWSLWYLKLYSPCLLFFNWYQYHLAAVWDAIIISLLMLLFAAFRPRLLSMCKYMGIDTKLFKFSFSDAYLRYMLRKRLQRWDTYLFIIRILYTVFWKQVSFLWEKLISW